MFSTPNRILILRTGGIGDVVLTLPAVEAIREAFPQAFLGYLVEDRAHPLVVNHPALDRTHVFRRWWLKGKLQSLRNLPEVFLELRGFIASLRKERYELVVDFQRNFKAGVLYLLSGVPHRLAFTRPIAIELNFLFPGKKVYVPPELSWRERFLALVRALGVTPGEYRVRFPPNPEGSERVHAFLKSHGLERWVALHPTASSFDPKRRWDPKNFAELAHLLHRYYGIPSLVTYGPGEEGIAQAVVEGSKGGAILSFPPHSLLDLVELYRHALLYIGCDTGPMHIASALGIPCVVLFGSGDPERYGPWSKGSKVICKKAQDGTLLPLTEMTPNMIMAELEGILPSLLVAPRIPHLS